MATASASIDPDPRAQKKLEQKIAARYRGFFSVRLVVSTVLQVAAWAGVIALAVGGAIPYWLACLANGWLAYLCYMTLHAATHGNVSGPRADLRWVDDVVGTVSSVPLWLDYRSHRISHMKHHAYTNDPARDPDHFVAGPFWKLFPKVALIATLQIVVPVLSLFPNGMSLVPASLRVRSGGSAHSVDPLEARYARRFQLAMLVAFVAVSLAGYFTEAFWLWFVPSKIGLFLIAFVFAWLPHLPFDVQGRYVDTRVTLFPGSTLLLRGQDHHVLHHMFPRVPHYNLPALFREMRPILEAQGTRIEGPLAGPGAPPIQLRVEA